MEIFTIIGQPHELRAKFKNWLSINTNVIINQIATTTLNAGDLNRAEEICLTILYYIHIPKQDYPDKDIVPPEPEGPPNEIIKEGKIL